MHNEVGAALSCESGDQTRRPVEDSKHYKRFIRSTSVSLQVEKSTISGPAKTGHWSSTSDCDGHRCLFIYSVGLWETTMAVNYLRLSNTTNTERMFCQW